MIYYENNDHPKNASITLYINNEKPISFEGYRAYNLHMLLSSPRKSIDIDSFQFTPANVNKKHGDKNRYLHTEFDYINGAIAKGWYQYGFIFGSNDLIRLPSSSDPCKYSYQINIEMSPLIKQVR